ncbi:hypothetical protein FA95DRAFT_1674386 [Auriscalpium vulgare]|uniref:Uncharacterized protein n=1 Tax=Auriscalpium vulgare TaxID=40419 RepID=A0ACB8SA39_9AGAM|nr:hypothetical protein FA95DRAFT_1674386 [Auriscalpium vulgare]
MNNHYSPPYYSNGFSTQPRPKDDLPYGPPAYHASTREHHRSPWKVTLLLPVPAAMRGRGLYICFPNLPAIHRRTVASFGRRRGTLILLFACISVVYLVFALSQRYGTTEAQWPTPYVPLFQGETSTLVYGREDLQKIWHWEIASGHYPSSREIPRPVRLVTAPLNPALPPRKVPRPPSRHTAQTSFVTHTIGHGAKRIYLDNQARPPNVGYPPRPVPGSIADLDIIMDLCDFSTFKYVRDCLEVLRTGGGLDNGMRVRRGNLDPWRYIYVEHGDVNKSAVAPAPPVPIRYEGISQAALYVDPDAGLRKKPRVEWERPIELPTPLEHRPYHTLPTTCDPENPRIFHMFWRGPFADPPYMALLSFLFTQNLRLHLHEADADALACRPQFWMWINPGPAAAVPNPFAQDEMFEQLQSSPWASPFLHPRFKDIISFKMWNTTEQLDSIPEVKDEWRTLRDTLFNSGGHVMSAPQQHEPEEETSVAEADADAVPHTPLGEAGVAPITAAAKSEAKAKSADKAYDQLSVVLSDMARFVLCHRYGGIYLDADTMFLRDWEELWGWKGQFAYRWSRLEKYNTAVLRMHKGSALGTFLFRTALKNGLDFHPMTVAKYMKDAHLENLLLRLPDALFDAAWLNTESFQRDRPPQPYFQRFSDFFKTPTKESAAPAALGFEGFFRGAYSYHFHNPWKPFDMARNWPDLGPHFITGERNARVALNFAANKTDPEHIPPFEDVADDMRDLSWSTVLKRTFEAYVRGERPNMYGEWLVW